MTLRERCDEILRLIDEAIEPGAHGSPSGRHPNVIPAVVEAASRNRPTTTREQ